ncbi:MAG: hypothetical protein KJ792_00630 [Actinobacteria bacterium]|nr:hypothetical protein [Actinomycetota bacterium]MCG2800874.1 hypothetical protein [Cellulomonas sp.]
MKMYLSSHEAAFARPIVQTLRGATPGFQGRGLPAGGALVGARGTATSDLSRTTVV